MLGRDVGGLRVCVGDDIGVSARCAYKYHCGKDGDAGTDRPAVGLHVAFSLRVLGPELLAGAWGVPPV